MSSQERKDNMDKSEQSDIKFVSPCNTLASSPKNKLGNPLLNIKHCIPPRKSKTSSGRRFHSPENIENSLHQSNGEKCQFETIDKEAFKQLCQLVTSDNSAIPSSYQPGSIIFPKSSRPEHFRKHKNLGTPSPATYKILRFLDTGMGQCDPVLLKQHQQRVKTTVSPYFSAGRTISKFRNQSKSYIQHSKHRQYQPEGTLGNPGVGQYEISECQRIRKMYSFGASLNRLNKLPQTTPGANAYEVTYPPAKKSFNVKKTFPQSQRTYLAHLNH